MASAAVSISCPACKKSFKGRSDLEGKKIRCPACEQPFVVRLGAAAKEGKAPKGDKADKEKAKGPPAEASKGAAPPPPPPKPADPFDEEDDPNPYGVTVLDMAPRCPNCANEMEDENAVVCLYCGYNTQTRTLGETKMTLETTFGRRLNWLAPGLGTASAALLLSIGCLYYSLILPEKLHDSWFGFLTHESLRLWFTGAALFAIWPLGYHAFKRLILQPTPPEIIKE